MTNLNGNFKEKYGPWALITGGTSGIGKAFAEQLAESGLNIVLVARRKPLLDQTAADLERQYGVQVQTIPTDLSDPAAVDTIIEATSDLDVGLLIPNAAVETNGSFIKNDLERENKLLQLNTIAPMQLAHHFGGQMSERGKGGILFVSSMAGYSAGPYLANYAASKAYILTLGESLYYELKKKGVDVSVLSPGLTNTPMAAGTGIDWSKMPMTSMDPESTAAVGLQALGRQPSVVPGKMNNIMAFMGKHIMSRKIGVNMYGRMMEKAIASDRL
ncbi:SDR family NAD(P)-dependent oxidoreductase [Chloroflexi bacterium TSY]|nr:SDR family NAD(P)-dependent oxidoreductase [Chloroflexi bacterium TSY]